MPKTQTSASSKVLSFITAKKWRPVIVIASFAVLGGGYMLYRSFAYLPVYAMQFSKGQTSTNASKVVKKSAQTVILKPGGSIALTYYPLSTARYDLCLKARAIANTGTSGSTVVLDADNSNNAKERANGYSQYSIRITQPTINVPYASSPVLKSGVACSSFNYAVYNPAGTIDRLGSKPPRLTFTAPQSNKTDIELELAVVAYKSSLDGR